jgi:hypothetical protein
MLVCVALVLVRGGYTSGGAAQGLGKKEWE